MRLWVVIALVSLASSAPAHPGHEEPASVGPDVSAELPASVYEKRRVRLMKRLGACAAVLKSHPSGEQRDPYFYYLTGVEEAGAALLLSPRGKVVKQALYFQPRDPEREVWLGYREPMSASLRREYRVDQAGRLRGAVPKGLEGALRRNRCYAYLRSALEKKPGVAKEKLGPYLEAFSARTEQKWEALERMRAIKDREEIARMEKAIAITEQGHRAAAASLRQGVTERQVAADLEKAFFDHGATGLAFPSIVGSGPNGAILHWEERERTIGEDDLVVVDIGSSYGGYASDITRTYPVSGKFSGEQRKVYEAVLAAQERVIDAVEPGVSLERLHRIGEQAILEAGYDFPHYIGHFVGLDVHDVGDRGAPLEPGMVITVEPGIYLKDRFGVRIEDMVLVTRRGRRLLTGALPKEPEALERWMGKVRAGAGRE